MNITLWIKRIFIYCLGLFSIAIGVALAVKSDLGVSPVNAIPYVVSLITGIELGRCVTIVFCCFIFIQLLILGKKFRIYRLLQIPAATVFGYFVTLASWLVDYIPDCGNYFLRLVYLGISLVFIAVGVDLYLKPKVMSLPTEGTMEAIVERFGISFPNVKTGFDTTVVVAASLVSLIAFHELRGVREGTIIAALAVGQLVKVWNCFTDKQLKEFLK